MSFDFDKSVQFVWEDERYLKPFLPNNSLLHNFVGDEDEEEDEPMALFDKEDIIKELGIVDNIEIIQENGVRSGFSRTSEVNGILKKSNGSLDDMTTDVSKEQPRAPISEVKDKRLKVSFANVVAKELKSTNDNYFGSYSVFGIHREMVNDKVIMDAYGGSILKNPSLMNQAIVMDVGCGTGILRVSSSSSAY